MAAAIKDARTTAGADVGEIMQHVVPIFYEVQGHIMEPLGFTPDDEGFAAFGDALKSHESDETFNEYSKKMKAIMKVRRRNGAT